MSTHEQARPLPPRTALVTIVIVLGLLGLYLSTLTSFHTHDSVFFAMSAEAAVGRGSAALSLFHPAHVLHQVAAAIIHGVLLHLGVHAGALIVLQFMSSIGGAVLAGLIAWYLARETGSLHLAAGAALLAGLAGGTWFYATDGECNGISLAFAVAALRPLSRALDGDRRACVVAAILLALSCGWHITLGTLWIGFLAVAALEGRRQLVRAITLLTGASALLFVFYIPRLVFLLREPGPFDLLSLVAFTGDTVEGGYLMKEGFRPHGMLLQMLRGFVDAPAGSTWALVARLLWALPVAALVAGLAVLVLRRADRATRMIAAWFVPTLALYSSWADYDYEFTNFLIVPAVMLGALAAARLLEPRARALAAIGSVAIVGALLSGWINWVVLIRPGLDPSANPYMRVADMIAAGTSPEDRIVVTGLERSRLKIYTLYFARRSAVFPEFFFGPAISQDESMRRFEAAMRAGCERGGRLFALGELVEETPLTVPDAFPLARVRASVRALGPVEAARDSAGTLYRLERCPPPEP